MTSPEYAEMIRARIDDATTHDIPYYHPNFDFIPPDHGTTHLNVLARDGSAVAMTSTINFEYVVVCVSINVKVNSCSALLRRKGVRCKRKL